MYLYLAPLLSFFLCRPFCCSHCSRWCAVPRIKCCASCWSYCCCCLPPAATWLALFTCTHAVEKWAPTWRKYIHYIHISLYILYSWRSSLSKNELCSNAIWRLLLCRVPQLCVSVCAVRQCCKMHLAAAANCIKIVFSTRRLRCVYQVSQLTTGNSTIYIYLTLFFSPSLSPSSSLSRLLLAVHYALINWNNFGVLQWQLGTGNWLH